MSVNRVIVKWMYSKNQIEFHSILDLCSNPIWLEVSAHMSIGVMIAYVMRSLTSHFFWYHYFNLIATYLIQRRRRLFFRHLLSRASFVATMSVTTANVMTLFICITFTYRRLSVFRFVYITMWPLIHAPNFLFGLWYFIEPIKKHFNFFVEYQNVCKKTS